MSELRTKEQTDTPPEPTETAGGRRGALIAPALFCILLLVVSPVTAADAGLYEDTWTGSDLHHQPAPNASVQDTTGTNLIAHQDAGRDQQIIHYVEDNQTTDHGEGVRQVRASVLRQIADLEDRGYDVDDLRSALESGDEERIKNALSNISACMAES